MFADFEFRAVEDERRREVRAMQQTRAATRRARRIVKTSMRNDDSPVRSENRRGWLRVRPG